MLDVGKLFGNQLVAELNGTDENDVSVEIDLGDHTPADVTISTTDGFKEVETNGADEETIVATESFNMNVFTNISPSTEHVPALFEAESMGPQQQTQRPPSRCLIRSSDGNNFRIYFEYDTIFDNNYMNQLCHFLDTRVEGQSVTFILGAKLYEGQAHRVGSIISAMMSCKAKVITVAAGYCSIPESMIWCFGEERSCLRYGALYFGITDFVKVCSKYKDYFEVFLKRAQEIGVLSPEEAVQVAKTTRGKFMMYSDFQK